MGHQHAWDYTPRQMSAFLIIAHRRQRHQMRDQLLMMATAMRAEPKDIEKRLKELMRETDL